MGSASEERDDAPLTTVAPPDLPSPATTGVKGQLSLTLFSATGDQMAELVVRPQRTTTVALSFEGSDDAGSAGPQHRVTFTRRGNQLFVSDPASESGLYLKLARNGSWLLDVAEKIRVGEQTLVFVAAPAETQSDAAANLEPFIGLLEVAAAPGTSGRTLVIPESGIVCGREHGDLIFPHDRFVSGQHCTISREDDGLVYLTDLGSTNGTFVHLTEEHPLEPGDILRAGSIFVRVIFRPELQRP
jgi:hypothetical protein